MTPKGRNYSTGNYDAAAADAQRHAESRAAFQAGQPKSTYSDPKGRSRPIDPKDVRVEHVRRYVTYDTWYSRPTRMYTVFGGYGQIMGWPVVIYSDPYGGSFWWWLLAQSVNTQAYWAYNHYDYMDHLRYRDMLDRNAELAARVRELEAQRVPRDPTYTPPGIDPDLMYSDSYVAAAVNPTEVTLVRPEYHFWRFVFHALLVIGIIGLLIWLVFIKRWGG